MTGVRLLVCKHCGCEYTGEPFSVLPSWVVVGQKPTLRKLVQVCACPCHVRETGNVDYQRNYINAVTEIFGVRA